MNLTISAATPADFTPLQALFLEGDGWHAAHEPSIFRVPVGPARDSAFLQSWLDAPESTILVAEADGTLAGVAMLLIAARPERPMLLPRRYGVIDTLIVAESFRRQGLGRRLMLAAEDWLGQQGCTDLEITVWDFNIGARELYASLGYRPLLHRLGKTLD